MRAAAGGDAEEAPADDEDEENFSLVDMLIARSRSVTEMGVTAAEWHREVYEGEIPDGYAKALQGSVDLVDVLVGTTDLKMIADANAALDLSPRYCLRLAPRPTFGLGVLMGAGLARSFSVLGPLNASLKRLGASSVDTLVLHGKGGRLSFPAWVYDAVAEAYEQGLCTKVGVSHAGAKPATLKRVAEELQKRGVALSCALVRLSLLDRGSLPLIQECRNLGIQTVVAVETLGPDELASGRFTAANPTGGEISVPRFTLTQLMPLRPLHDALGSVAARVRAREPEKEGIDTTAVAIQWCVSKGASPLVDVGEDSNAKALVACSGWQLLEDEVEQLDKAADQVKAP